MKLGKDVNCRFDAVVLGAHDEIEWLKNIIIL
jgi:Holliday junction resolvase-like predicted endonuclease